MNPFVLVFIIDVQNFELSLSLPISYLELNKKLM